MSSVIDLRSKSLIVCEQQEVEIRLRHALLLYNLISADVCTGYYVPYRALVIVIKGDCIV